MNIEVDPKLGQPNPSLSEGKTHDGSGSVQAAADPINGLRHGGYRGRDTHC